MKANSTSGVPQTVCSSIAGYDPAWNCLPQPPYNQLVFYTALGTTIAWCIVIVLAVIAFRGISKAKNTYSPRMQRILQGYIALMSLFSTGALAQNVIYVQNLLFSTYDLGANSAVLGALIYTAVSITLPFTVFGADGLMAWRCWILYRVVRPPLRIPVYCLLAFLLICSLASAGVTFGLADSNFAPATPLLAVTITVNLILSTLIVSRLLYHERCLRRVLGIREKKSPFRHVMAMCVESCALIVVFSVFALGMEWSPSDTFWDLSAIPFILLPHICVISPFLIIIRVANGRAPATTIIPSSVDPEDDVEASKRIQNRLSLRFTSKRPTSTFVSPPSLASKDERKIVFE